MTTHDSDTQNGRRSGAARRPRSGEARKAGSADGPRTDQRRRKAIPVPPAPAVPASVIEAMGAAAERHLGVRPPDHVVRLAHTLGAAVAINVERALGVSPRAVTRRKPG